MKAVAAALAAVLAAGLAGAGAAKERSVLGWAYTTRHLAWFDPGTLRSVGARTSATRGGFGSWSLSPQGARLAASDGRGSIALYDVGRTRYTGNLEASGVLGVLNGVSWLRPDRLLTVKTVEDTSTLIVVDPLRKRVLRRVELPGIASHRTIVGDGAVFFLGAQGENFRPARVAVVDADGGVRTATIDRITTGLIVTRAGEPTIRSRTPGFAVDVAGRRAFVVGPDLLVAEVDLDRLTVEYHGPVRSLAKSIEGPSRTAAWLGNGLLAVAGADNALNGSQPVTTPFGLRLVDTRTWTARTIDAAATDVVPAGSLLVAPHDGAWTVWGLDGKERYRLTLPRGQWLSVQGRYAYVCKSRDLVRILDAATGATAAAPRGRPCVSLLLGRSSAW